MAHGPHSGPRTQFHALNVCACTVFSAGGRPERIREECHLEFDHEGRGHSLRTGEPAMGPMDDAAKSCLLKEIEEMLSLR
jgi:hypothetical protein